MFPEWRRHFMERNLETKEEMKRKLIDETIPKYLGKVNDIKKKNGGTFLLGDKLTWVDIQYAHFLELFVDTMGAQIAAPFTNLLELQKAVFEIPEIKVWIECRPKTEF
jgi:glutathione S-transferase